MEHTFEGILEEVSNLEYSENSFLDLISCIEKAIKIAEAKGLDRRNPCFNNLIQTKEKERDFMMERDIPDSEREDRFNEARRNFKVDLNHCID